MSSKQLSPSKVGKSAAAPNQPKVHKACDECRTRKLGCSKGHNPGCARCVKEGIPCNYSPQLPMGRPRKNKDASRPSSPSSPSSAASLKSRQPHKRSGSGSPASPQRAQSKAFPNKPLSSPQPPTAVATTPPTPDAAVSPMTHVTTMPIVSVPMDPGVLLSPPPLSPPPPQQQQQQQQQQIHHKMASATPSLSPNMSASLFPMANPPTPPASSMPTPQSFASTHFTMPFTSPSTSTSAYALGMPDMPGSDSPLFGVPSVSPIPYQQPLFEPIDIASSPSFYCPATPSGVSPGASPALQPPFEYDAACTCTCLAALHEHLEALSAARHALTTDPGVAAAAAAVQQAVYAVYRAMHCQLCSGVPVAAGDGDCDGVLVALNKTLVLGMLVEQACLLAVWLEPGQVNVQCVPWVVGVLRNQVEKQMQLYALFKFRLLVDSGVLFEKLHPAQEAVNAAYAAASHVFM